MFYSPLVAFLYRLERPFTKFLSTVGFTCERRGRRNSHITVRARLSYFLGVKIRGLLPARVLKCQITSVRGLVVPCSVMSRKNNRKYSVLFRVNTSLIGKNCLDHAHKTEFWYLLGGSFQNFRRSPPSLFYGRNSPPPPRGGSCYYI